MERKKKKKEKRKEKENKKYILCKLKTFVFICAFPSEITALNAGFSFFMLKVIHRWKKIALSHSYLAIALCKYNYFTVTG